MSDSRSTSASPADGLVMSDGPPASADGLVMSDGPPASADGRAGSDGSRLLLASWGERLGSALIDLCIVVPIPFFIWAMFATFKLATFWGEKPSYEDYYELGIGTLILLAILFVFFSVVSGILTGIKGRTIGKFAVKLKVVSAVDNRRNIKVSRGLVRETVRSAFGIISFSSVLIPDEVEPGWLPSLSLLCLVVFLVDHLWPLWDRNNQTLHDKVVRSHVVVTGRN